MEKNKEKMLELLADQILFGLTEEETAELENLKKNFPEFKGDDSFERAAAAINLTQLGTEDTLPAHLQAKLERQAEEFSAALQPARQFSSIENNQTAELPQEAFARSIDEFAPKRPIWQWLGWAVAAAACVALAATLWLTRSRPQPEIADSQKTVQTPEAVQNPEVIKTPETERTPEIAAIPEITKTPAANNVGDSKSLETAKNPEPDKRRETLRNSASSANQETAGIPKIGKTPDTPRTAEPIKTPAPELTAAQKREQLIASAPDVVQTNWTSAKDKKLVLGDVVWSNAQQKGYVRLRNMPVLDPTQETYQLWIVDEAQNKKTPVSGGIFNVSQTGEIVVPINAQLRIQQPKQFAVSKEKAGGVVVSKPNRIVAIAEL